MNNLLFIIPDYTGIVTGSSKRSKILCDNLSKNWKVIIISRKNIIELYNNKVISEKKATFLSILSLLLTTKFSFWFCDFIKWSLLPIPNLIFTLHDIKEWTEFGRRGLIKKFFLYIVIKKSKYLFTVSKNQRILIKQKLGFESHVFPNAVSKKWLEYSQKFENTTKSDNDKYIIYVSNFTRHKCHIDLIYNNPLFNSYKFVFVGSAIDANGLLIKNYLQKISNVKIYTNISESKLRSLVNSSSFVVFPSVYEGYGMPILESIALKKRVLISDKLMLDHFDGCELVRSVSFDKDLSKKDIIWATSSTDEYENNCKCLVGWDQICYQIDSLLKS